MTENAFDYIRDIIAKVWQYPAVKFCVGAVLGLSKLLFGVYRPAYGAVLVLFGLDFLLGFGWALRYEGADSHKGLRGISKLLVYGVLLIVGRQLSIIPVIGPVISGMIDGLIMLTEGISVLEKIDKWGTSCGREIALVKPILALLQQRRKRIVDDAIEKKAG